MSGPEELFEDMTGPMLRLYRGEGNESDVPGVEEDFDEASAKHSAAEVEAFWAGRLPANRHSARVAA